jgi:hypothetical protein
MPEPRELAALIHECEGLAAPQLSVPLHKMNGVAPWKDTA